MNLGKSQRTFHLRGKSQGSSKPVKKTLKESASAMQSQAKLKNQTLREEAGPRETGSK